MLVRRENPSDVNAVRAVVAAAFSRDGETAPAEVRLLDGLRACDAWLPPLSLMAVDAGSIVGHVVCTRALVGAEPALGLGPLAVSPPHQGSGVGQALVHAVLGAAEALDEPLVVLLGSPAYYARFGFEPAAAYGITPPVPAWGPHFQARPLTTYRPSLRGPFAYAAPFAL